MDKDIHMDETILLRYFAGELGTEENERVRLWILESEENEKLAQDIYYINFSMETLLTARDIDARMDLEKVNRRVYGKRIRRILRFVQHAAAILFIPLLFTFIYQEMKQEPMLYLEAHANAGMITSVELSDGSKVWLNSDSYLRYPVKFSKDNREVYLNGEAYFSVAKNPKKRFVVNTSQDLKVEVLGTEFNMDAYATNDFVATTLVEGSVRLSYIKEGQEKTILMKPDQKIIYSQQDKHIKKSSDIYVSEDISWKDGCVVLKNTSLEDAAWILSKRFNVEFEISRSSLKENSFTGTFDDQSLTNILDHIEISSGIKYRIEKRENKSTNELLKDKIVLY